MTTFKKLTEQLSFRVSLELYNLVEEIARDERRKPNEVARALLDRGAAAFRRDGELFEPLQGAVSEESALTNQENREEKRQVPHSLGTPRRKKSTRKTGNS